MISVTEGLIKRILEMESALIRNSTEFSTLSEDNYLAESVSDLETITSKCLEKVTLFKEYALSQAESSITSIDTHYSLTGALEDDEERLAREIRKFKEGSDIYRWLGLKIGNEENIKKALQERNSYFLTVHATLGSAKKDKEIIQNNGWINALDFSSVTVEILRRIADAKKEAYTLEERYKSFLEDPYLKGPSIEVIGLAKMTQEHIGTKISEIIEETKRRVEQIDPEFISSGEIEEDISISLGQQTLCNRALSIYTELNADPAELNAKSERVNRTHDAYKEIVEAKNKMEIDYRRIKDYNTVIEKFMEQKVTEESAQTVSSIIVQLSKDMDYYCALNANPAFEPYKIIKEMALAASLLLAPLQSKIVERLSDKTQHIIEKVTAVEQKITMYETGSPIRRCLQYVFRPNELQEIRNIAEGCRSELEIIGRLNYCL